MDWSLVFFMLEHVVGRFLIRASFEFLSFVGIFKKKHN